MVIWLLNMKWIVPVLHILIQWRHYGSNCLSRVCLFVCYSVGPSMSRPFLHFAFCVASTVIGGHFALFKLVGVSCPTATLIVSYQAIKEASQSLLSYKAHFSPSIFCADEIFPCSAAIWRWSTSMSHYCSVLFQTLISAMQTCSRALSRSPFC